MISSPFFQFESIRKDQERSSVAVSGRVPLEAPFFQDHFPDFPVLPGVLSFQVMLQAIGVYYEKPLAHLKLKEISQAKFSKWLFPGDSYEAELICTEDHGRRSRWNGRISCQKQSAVSAKLELEVL